MYKLLLPVIIALILIPSAALGAELYFGAGSKSIDLQKPFQVGVFINTGGTSVNAIESGVIYPAGSARLEQVIDGGTIISVWLERPSKPECVQSQCRLNFSGIIPGGYTGPSGRLFTLIFTPLKAGQFSIKTVDENVLANDGQGTMVKLTSAPINLAIVESGAASGFLLPSDSMPPEPFVIQLVQDENLNESQWTIVFNTQDKGSGINHYEVTETTRNQVPDDGWQIAESPYRLKDQSLSSYVFVKAVDHTGNFMVASLEPASQKPAAYIKIWILGIIILAIVFVTLRHLRHSFLKK